MMECWSDADQKCSILILYSIFSCAFLFPAALCCQLTLTRLLRSRYDACVILTRSRGIWLCDDHPSRFFTDYRELWRRIRSGTGNFTLSAHVCRTEEVAVIRKTAGWNRREFLKTTASVVALAPLGSLIGRNAFAQSAGRNRITVAHGVGVYSLNP